jgi:hypothetical protein
MLGSFAATPSFTPEEKIDASGSLVYPDYYTEWTQLYLTMVACPYCEKPFPRSAPDLFEVCPNCGYRSAQIDAADGGYLIIDSNLPDLISRYKKIHSENDALVVVIDRRVSYNPIAGVDRRRHLSG